MLDEIILNALKEDIGEGDHSSLACLKVEDKGSAKLLVKEDGILAGVHVAQRVFQLHDASLEIDVFIEDGKAIKVGDIVMEVRGKAQSILSTERLVLNIMQRMSGIASLTRHLNKKINHTKCKILDTRKTTPGFRYPEKWAVTIGGGYNHRMGLFDAIIIKDNHVDFCGGMQKTLLKTKDYLDRNQLKIDVVVEVRTQIEIETVMNFPWVKRILLDNMGPDQIKEKVAWINKAFETEASGSISEENLIRYAETGVDFISMGALTHSAKNVDLSLKAL